MNRQNTDRSLTVLAADVGGTHSRLGLFTVAGMRVSVLAEAVYPSRRYGALEEVVAVFLHEQGEDVALHGCFAVAGPVRGGICDATNLPWRIDARSLADRFGLRTAVLLNDLEANAWGIGTLAEDDFHTLQAGMPGAQGNAAVIAAGTGLGEAGLYWDGSRHHPFPSEGGHADFAPTDMLEMELLAYLRQRLGRVSWERVLSGPGLINLYDFLRCRDGAAVPAWLQRAMAEGDAAAAVAEAGLANRDPICTEAVSLFVRLYGAEAGNLALKFMATGGVYLGGGIAPKILRKLGDDGFREAFLAKGRLRPLLETIPVKVILNERTALYGAALRAATGYFSHPQSQGGAP